MVFDNPDIEASDDDIVGILGPQGRISPRLSKYQQNGWRFPAFGD